MGAWEKTGALWLAAALAAFLLWMGLTALTIDDGEKAPLGLQFAADFAFVLACASGCFFFVAVFLPFGQHRSPVYDSLSEGAYGMYLVHYVFVVRMQYALLGIPLLASPRSRSCSASRCS